MKNIFLAVMMSLCFSSASFADTKACDAAGSTAEMTECLGHEYAVSLQKMIQTFNDFYAVLVGIDQELANRLDSEQSAWVSYQTSHCYLEGGQMMGGSGEGVIFLGCRIRMTDERTQSLLELQKAFQN